MKTPKKRKTKYFQKNGIDYKKLNGYIFVKIGRKYEPEHRLVVEEKIGRMLEKEEVVHHLNSKRDDNKIENLMLFPNQKEHSKFHNKIRQFGLTNPIKRQIENRWEN